MPDSYTEGFRDGLELITLGICNEFGISKKYLEMGEKFMKNLPKRDKNYHLGVASAEIIYFVGTSSLVSVIAYIGLEYLK